MPSLFPETFPTISPTPIPPPASTRSLPLLWLSGRDPRCVECEANVAASNFERGPELFWLGGGKWSPQSKHVPETRWI